MMDPNRFWENQAVSLLRSVRRTLGGSATSRDVLAVVEDPVRLEGLAQEHQAVSDRLSMGVRAQETVRRMAVHLLHRADAAENYRGRVTEAVTSRNLGDPRRVPQRHLSHTASISLEREELR